MNKQEQIEKMATILACGRCGQPSWDCPEDEDLKRYVKEAAKPTASLLASKGYIDGADFVEWLKSSRFMKPYCMGISMVTLNDALQEYLKGE